MSKKIFSIRNILIGTVIIAIDLAIYLFLGVMLMSYDDFYDERKGAYFSLESMTTAQKINYIGFDIWGIINLMVIAFIIYRLIKKNLPKNTLPP